MLRRLLNYGDKLYGISSMLDDFTDDRKQPQIETSTVMRSSWVATLSRLGSLNALEQTQDNAFWRKWLKTTLPSAETIGRVMAKVKSKDIRRMIKRLYTKLKRNKALKPFIDGNYMLVVDGHEACASYLRSCDACLTRTIHAEGGDKIQYYHRHVTAMLVCDNFHLLLDVEPQKPGEDEVAAANRLFERVIKDYPQAFNIILADGLYARAPFIKMVLKNRKGMIAVLKDERRDLLQDARGLFASTEPCITYEDNGITYQCWDIEHFTSWEQMDREMRVVRSLETKTVHRQRTETDETITSEWIWAATCSIRDMATKILVKIAHHRWDIEEQGFNELCNQWHFDHVYTHQVDAMENFWLLTMLSYNIFQAFINLNIKPEIRKEKSKIYWAQIIKACLYSGEPSYLQTSE
jgi:hypothetical protein